MTSAEILTCPRQTGRHDSEWAVYSEGPHGALKSELTIQNRPPLQPSPRRLSSGPAELREPRRCPPPRGPCPPRRSTLEHVALRSGRLEQKTLFAAFTDLDSHQPPNERTRSSLRNPHLQSDQ
ncbi:MAG: hypothetical protein IPK72_23900 [Candidatus Eisenbacteria bacterium]|nr:hypothetical protein [Candidatus Eisenbacteria bacterium]